MQFVYITLCSTSRSYTYCKIDERHLVNYRVRNTLVTRELTWKKLNIPDYTRIATTSFYSVASLVRFPSPVIYLTYWQSRRRSIDR